MRPAGSLATCGQGTHVAGWLLLLLLLRWEAAAAAAAAAVWAAATMADS